ncbi:MAG: hypothetical protein N2505_00245 [Endomicrobia bacterium]|nr:hypothetical protein [Endomicrobiia bacterium]
MFVSDNALQCYLNFILPDNISVVKDENIFKITKTKQKKINSKPQKEEIKKIICTFNENEPDIFEFNYQKWQIINNDLEYILNLKFNYFYENIKKNIITSKETKYIEHLIYFASKLNNTNCLDETNFCFARYLELFIISLIIKDNILSMKNRMDILNFIIKLEKPEKKALEILTKYSTEKNKLIIDLGVKFITFKQLDSNLIKFYEEILQSKIKANIMNRIIENLILIKFRNQELQQEVENILKNINEKLYSSKYDILNLLVDVLTNKEIEAQKLIYILKTKVIRYILNKTNDSFHISPHIFMLLILCYFSNIKINNEKEKQEIKSIFEHIESKFYKIYPLRSISSSVLQKNKLKDNRNKLFFIHSVLKKRNHKYRLKEYEISGN